MSKRVAGPASGPLSKVRQMLLVKTGAALASRAPPAAVNTHASCTRALPTCRPLIQHCIQLRIFGRIGPFLPPTPCALWALTVDRRVLVFWGASASSTHSVDMAGEPSRTSTIVHPTTHTYKYFCLL